MTEEQIVTFQGSSGLLQLVGASILVDPSDFKGIQHAGRALAEDFGRVTRDKSNPFVLVADSQSQPLSTDTAIIIGCVDSCWMLKKLVAENKLDIRAIQGKWESFITSVVKDPIPGCSKALVIAGSDKRAAIFGAYTLSRQMGVSPFVSPPLSMVSESDS